MDSFQYLATYIRYDRKYSDITCYVSAVTKKNSVWMLFNSDGNYRHASYMGWLKQTFVKESDICKHKYNTSRTRSLVWQIYHNYRLLLIPL